MNRSVFIFSTDSDSGKSLITLGVMQMILKKTPNVAFLFPIIENNSVIDDYTTTVVDYFQLKMQHEETFVFPKSEAVTLYNTGKKHSLFDKILRKDKKLEEFFSFIVVEGYNSFTEKSIFYFDLNNSIAKHLHLPIIFVVNGNGKNIEELVDHILIESKNIEGNIIMVVINQTYISAEKLSEYLNNRFPSEILFVSIPPSPGLGKPTLIEVKRELKADLIIVK
ncbi:MAG: AAA family ATPase [Candidatus Walczuchella monophlebidarum]